MLSCRELLDVLDDYAAGDLTFEQQLAVESHLRACRTCSDLAERYRQDQMGHRLAFPARPAGMTGRLEVLGRRGW